MRIEEGMMKQSVAGSSTPGGKPMRLIVHPGIGDLSWVISKLSTTGRMFDLVIAEDHKTRRSMPLVDMVPCINSAVYGGHEVYGPLSKCGNATFADYLEAERAGVDLYMTANNWLENGKRLEGFLPDLATDFHYTLNIPDKDRQWAVDQVSQSPRAFGIYTSAQGGIDTWRAWSVREWAEFVYQVYCEFPDTVFYLLGARWDMDMRLPMLHALDDLRVSYVDFIGRTSLPRAVALLHCLDYFAGFASGLTILADVVNRPVCMLYPDHLTKLMHSWPDPANLANGIHQAVVWDRPLLVFNKILPQLHRWLD
jgi:hypothetical protein